MQTKTITIEMEAELYDFINATVARDFQSVTGFLETQLLLAAQREAVRYGTNPTTTTPGHGWDGLAFQQAVARLEASPPAEFRDIEDGHTGYPFPGCAAVPFVVPTETFEAFQKVAEAEDKPYLWLLPHLVSHALRYRFSVHRRNPEIRHCDDCGATWETPPESTIQEPRQAGGGETLIPMPEDLADLVHVEAKLQGVEPGACLAALMMEQVADLDRHEAGEGVTPCATCVGPGNAK